MKRLLLLVMLVASVSSFATQYRNLRIEGPFFIYKNSTHWFKAYATNQNGFREDVTWRTSFNTSCGYMGALGVMYTDDRNGYCYLNAWFNGMFDTKSFYRN